MAIERWAVVHQRKGSVVGYRRAAPEGVEAFHGSEREARAACDRWRKRRPEDKWRVAHLREDGA